MKTDLDVYREDMLAGDLRKRGISLTWAMDALPVHVMMRRVNTELPDWNIKSDGTD